MSNIKTLEDLHKSTNAFANYDTMEKMKIRKIPVEYHECLPNYCECGAEMIITSDLTEAQCCDPYCRIKMGYNLAYFISTLGYKGFGPTLCARLIDHIYSDDMFPSFLVAFETSTAELLTVLGEHGAQLFEEIRESIKGRPLTLRESMAALGIPNVGSRSRVFDFLNSAGELAYILTTHKVDEFLDGIGLTAPTYKYGFAVFEPSIAYLYSNIVKHVIEESKTLVYIAITGEVSIDGSYYTRKNFLEYCSSIVDDDGVPLYKFKETTDSKKLEWVIADRPSNSEKFKKGERLGCLITADDFVKKIKDRTLKNKQEG